MRTIVNVLTGVGLFWIIQSLDSLGVSEPYYWLRLVGCVFIGVVVSTFYVKGEKR